MELIWMGSAVVLGLGLGVLGYFFSKAAYSIFSMSMSAFVLFSSTIADRFGLEPTGGGITVPVGEESSVSITQIGNIFYRAVDNMGLLPQYVQLSIMFFALAFFVARLATWVYIHFYPKKEEDKAARKKRILAEYGYTDGRMPY